MSNERQVKSNVWSLMCSIRFRLDSVSWPWLTRGVPLSLSLCLGFSCMGSCSSLYVIEGILSVDSDPASVFIPSFSPSKSSSTLGNANAALNDALDPDCCSESLVLYNLMIRTILVSTG